MSEKSKNAPVTVQPEDKTAIDSNDNEPKNTETGNQASENNSTAEVKKGDQTLKSPSPQLGKEGGTQQEKPKRKKSRLILILVMLVLVMSLIAGGSGYLGFSVWQTYQKDKQAATQEMLLIQQELADMRDKNIRLTAAQSESQGNTGQVIGKIQNRLSAAEQRIIAQNKRLQSMSTTSREDWLLAEAEYLLKLANQRVLVERSAKGTDALLVEADAILRDMADPDLFSLRQAIARDLAALRLTKAVDVEGLYLNLQALAGQVEHLPTKHRPVFGNDKNNMESSEDEALETENAQKTATWWQKPWYSFKRFAFAFKDQINIKDHEDGVHPVVLMRPDTVLYLQQNLRMQIERAQLALLREQQKIYRESLLQAAEWITIHFPGSQKSQSFKKELVTLAEKNIVQELPDISGSLELLNTYIGQLHDLQGIDTTQEKVE